MAEFNAELCNQRHEDQERRMATMEQALKESDAKQEERLTRIHQRFDEVSEKLLTRLPAWVTIMIGFLAAACTGLAVAAIK